MNVSRPTDKMEGRWWERDAGLDVPDEISSFPKRERAVRPTKSRHIYPVGKRTQPVVMGLRNPESEVIQPASI